MTRPRLEKCPIVLISIFNEFTITRRRRHPRHYVLRICYSEDHLIGSPRSANAESCPLAHRSIPSIQHCNGKQGHNRCTFLHIRCLTETGAQDWTLLRSNSKDSLTYNVVIEAFAIRIIVFRFLIFMMYYISKYGVLPSIIFELNVLLMLFKFNVRIRAQYLLRCYNVNIIHDFPLGNNSLFLYCLQTIKHVIIHTLTLCTKILKLSSMNMSCVILDRKFLFKKQPNLIF